MSAARPRAAAPLTVAATIASAYNEWQQELWLEFDERYRGCIVVPPQHPQAAVAEIERMADTEDGRLEIHAVIWVEREGQKAIVIGEKGHLLKEVGRSARYDLNALFGRRTHLVLWVKVKDNWADSANALRAFGYDGFDG